MDRVDIMWTARSLAAIVLAAVFVLLFGPPWIVWLKKRLLDSDYEWTVETLHRTPSMGGVLVIAAILMTTVLLADLRVFAVQMILFCLVLYGTIGTAQNWLRMQYCAWSHSGALRPWVMPACLGYVTMIIALMASGQGELGVFLVAMVVIPASSVSAILTDGMDGLASGILAMIALGLAVMCFHGAGPGAAGAGLHSGYWRQELGLICCGVCGACVAFLKFNGSRAKIFLGWSGSLPLGAVLGCVAVAIHRELLLALMGGVLLAETGSVVLQVAWFRMSGRHRLFRCAPLHHHFHLGGWPEKTIVRCAWVVTVILVALAIVLDRLA